MLFVFYQREQVDNLRMIIFFYSSRKEIDAIYDQLKDIALQEPKDNPMYRIYYFYVKDPEGRNIEF